MLASVCSAVRVLAPVAHAACLGPCIPEAPDMSLGSATRLRRLVRTELEAKGLLRCQNPVIPFSRGTLFLTWHLWEGIWKISFRSEGPPGAMLDERGMDVYQVLHDVLCPESPEYLRGHMYCGNWRRPMFGQGVSREFLEKETGWPIFVPQEPPCTNMGGTGYLAQCVANRGNPENRDSDLE